MNDPVNLYFYAQIVALEHDFCRNDRIFKILSHSYQRALQSIAHSRNLEYEYHNGCARVFRRTTEQISGSPCSDNLDAIFTDSFWESPIQTSMKSLLGHNATDTPAMNETEALSLLPNQHTPLSVYDPMKFPTSAELLEPSPDQIADGAMAMFESTSLSQQASSDAISPFLGFSGIQQPCGSLDSQPFQQQQTAMPSFNPSQAFIPDETTSMLHSTQPGLTTENDYFYSLDMSPSSPQYAQLFDSKFELTNDGDLRDGESDRCLARVDSVPDNPLNDYQYPQISHLSRGSSFTSDRPASSDPPSPSPWIPSAFPNSKPSSRAGSISSLHSDRGRSRVSKIFRRNSNGSIYSSGKGEHVFDFNQARSSSRASSGRSVRTGPLDKIARAGMKAVLAIGGACWRCKILGKKVSFRNEFGKGYANRQQCTAETPCDSCPKRKTTPLKPWEAVGCRRGTLGDEMDPVNFCSKSYDEDAADHTFPATARDLHPLRMSPQFEDQYDKDPRRECQRGTYISTPVDDVEAVAEITHLLYKDDTERRNTDIARALYLGTDTIFGRGSRIVNLHLLTTLSLSSCPASLARSLAPRRPDNECILAILWEFLEKPECVSHLSLFDRESETALLNFTILLRCAAFCEENLERVSCIFYLSIYILSSFRCELKRITLTESSEITPAHCFLTKMSSRSS